MLEAARQIMLNTFIDLENQRTQTGRAPWPVTIVQALNDLLQAQNKFMLIFITLRSAAADSSTSAWARCSSTTRACGSIRARWGRIMASMIRGCGKTARDQYGQEPGSGRRFDATTRQGIDEFRRRSCCRRAIERRYRRPGSQARRASPRPGRER